MEPPYPSINILCTRAHAPKYAPLCRPRRRQWWGTSTSQCWLSRAFPGTAARARRSASALDRYSPGVRRTPTTGRNGLRWPRRWCPWSAVAKTVVPLVRCGSRWRGSSQARQPVAGGLPARGRGSGARCQPHIVGSSPRPLSSTSSSPRNRRPSRRHLRRWPQHGREVRPRGPGSAPTMLRGCHPWGRSSSSRRRTRSRSRIPTIYRIIRLGGQLTSSCSGAPRSMSSLRPRQDPRSSSRCGSFRPPWCTRTPRGPEPARSASRRAPRSGRWSGPWTGRGFGSSATCGNIVIFFFAWTVSRPFLSPTPPDTRRVTRSTWRPCWTCWNSGWCLQSDVVSNFTFSRPARRCRPPVDGCHQILSLSRPSRRRQRLGFRRHPRLTATQPRRRRSSAERWRRPQ